MMPIYSFTYNYWIVWNFTKNYWTMFIGEEQSSSLDVSCCFQLAFINNKKHIDYFLSRGTHLSLSLPTVGALKRPAPFLCRTCWYWMAQTHGRAVVSRLKADRSCSTAISIFKVIHVMKNYQLKGDSKAQLYIETRPPVIWTAKNHCGWVEIWVDGWWMGKKRRSTQKNKSSKTIDIVSYASQESVNGMYVCSPF